jgi:hypothetical protein
MKPVMKQNADKGAVDCSPSTSANRYSFNLAIVGPYSSRLSLCIEDCEDLLWRAGGGKVVDISG